jgi:hypothetical protein
MAYVVMQKGLETPRVEQLSAAFRGIPGLTPVDAAIMCKDSLGILARGLEQTVALQLQAALLAQGVDTEVMDQTALPVLPQMMGVLRVDCMQDALIVCDMLGRKSSLDWKDVMLIAAGKVAVIEFKRKSSAAIAPEKRGGLGMIDEFLFKGSGLPQPGETQLAYPDPDYHTAEKRHDRWMAEVITRGAAMRCHFEAQTAGQILFHYLEGRRTGDVAENFTLLAQDLCSHAPAAAINRGAYYLREGNANVLTYPGRNAFYDEIVWLLWRLKT